MTDDNLNDKDNGPWYKQFWAWFVFAPLLIVMVAWIPFMAIALKDSDDMVVDNYYKEGRMINQRVDQDRLAAELGLSGELSVDLEVGDVVVVMSADSQYRLPQALTLSLDHPIEADNDLVITLHETVSGRYQGELDRRLQYRWYVRLSPVITPPAEGAEPLVVSDDQVWRIVGELDFAKGSRLIFGEHE